MRAVEAPYRQDLLYRVRQTVGPWIDRLARRLGQPQYQIRSTEYVGTVYCSIEDLEAKLRTTGFTWAPFSLYHRTPIGTSTDGSWTYRPSLFADRQLHLILFVQAAERVDLYAHTEYNWLRHPLQHAKQQGIHRQEAAKQMRRWLEEQAIDYHHESVVSRKAAHVMEKIREQLSTPLSPR